MSSPYNENLKKPLPDVIVESARSWVGTRFHHQGRLKKTDMHKGGVDCLGLLVGVAGEVGLRHLTMQDETNYTHTPDAARLRATLAALLTEVSAIKPGDIVLMNVDGNPQHLGIVAQGQEGLQLIHAYAPARAVVEHRLDDAWQSKVVAVFRVDDSVIDNVVQL